MLYTLNLKRWENAGAKSADKVFVGLGFQLRLDKRPDTAKITQSVERTGTTCPLGSTVCSGSFVSTPPATVRTPCFQVRQNGKSFAWKIASGQETSDTIPAF